MEDPVASQQNPVCLPFYPRKFVYRTVEPCSGSPQRRKTDRLAEVGRRPENRDLRAGVALLWFPVYK
jgi:hypothetical protein